MYELEKLNPSVSGATVYKHVQKLIDSGIVKEVALDDQRRQGYPWKFYGLTEEGREFVEEHSLLAVKNIQYHPAGVSLSNTVAIIEDSGVNGVGLQVITGCKSDLQPVGGETADQVAVDQKSIQVNDEEYWLYAQSILKRTESCTLAFCPTYTIAIWREFLTELCEKHDVSDAVFLVDGAADLACSLR